MLLDCLRTMSLFNRVKGYNPVSTCEMISMIPEIGTIKRIGYFNEEGRRLYKKTLGDSVMKFVPNGLVIEEFHIRYEWIASFKIINNVLFLLTFTDIVDNQVRKCDQLTYAVFYFDNNQFGKDFNKYFMNNVHRYAKTGKFDSSIMSMKSFQRAKRCFMNF